MKLLAPDGKRRLADAVDHEGVIQLAKSVPNNKAMAFLDWFTYSANSKKPSPLLIGRKGTITARYANKKCPNSGTIFSNRLAGIAEY